MACVSDGARGAKRQATDENNVVRGVLQNSDRQTGDRHQEMDQRMTKVEGSSQKMKRKVAKLGKGVKNAAFGLVVGNWSLDMSSKCSSVYLFKH